MVLVWTVTHEIFPNSSPLLISVLLVGSIAWATRAMHLDGLADVADGLGSGKAATEARAIMKRSDIGPFGVITVVLVLLLQVGALSQIMVSFGVDGTSLVLFAAIACSRGTLVLLGTSGYPAASDRGLGATVAQSVTGARLVVGMLLIVAVVATAGLLASQTVLTGQGRLWLCACGPLGILAGLLRAITAKDRFGGVTGDVYGASIEIAFTAALVTAALGASL